MCVYLLQFFSSLEVVLIWLAIDWYSRNIYKLCEHERKAEQWRFERVAGQNSCMRAVGGKSEGGSDQRHVGAHGEDSVPTQWIQDNIRHCSSMRS